MQYEVVETTTNTELTLMQHTRLSFIGIYNSFLSVNIFYSRKVSC
jgi:hypothetical protein